MSKWRSAWHRLARGSSAWKLGFLCGVGFCGLSLLAPMDLAYNFNPSSSNRCNVTGKTLNLDAIRIRAFPYDSSNRIPASAESTHAFPNDLKLPSRFGTSSRARSGQGGTAINYVDRAVEDRSHSEGK
jgi:hypothetical protein